MFYSFLLFELRSGRETVRCGEARDGRAGEGGAVRAPLPSRRIARRESGASARLAKVRTQISRRNQHSAERSA